MNASMPYVIASIVALLILAVLAYATIKSGRPTRLTPLAGLAFAFVLAGVLFGDSALIGYALIGVGVVLAIIDIIKKSRGPVG